ncbi:MAG TPA: hypothetical protein VF921_02490 [Vicinamibacterales bacterium]
MPIGRICSCLVVSLAIAVPAAAQQKEPIGRFAADLRGIFVRHKAEPSVATELGVTPVNLPARSFGLAAGAHVYPWRGNKITLGFGGAFVLGRGSRTLDILDANGKPTVPPTKTPTVRRHFTSIAPEISLNFGHRNGWSYISGGMFGRSKLYTDRVDAPATNAPQRKTLTYGGGARWFTSEHLAFSVDFHWYSIAEQPAAAGLVFQPRTTLLVLSGGISFK